MQRTHIWHQFIVHSGKVILLALLAFPFLAEAQYKDNVGRYAYENDLKFQRRKFHFGIILGFNSSSFKINRSLELATSDSINTVDVSGGTGFNLGILTSLHLHKNLELRFTPGVSFMEKTLNYGISNGTLADKKIEQIFIETPIHIKFKSDPIGNFKVYVLGGIKYGFDLSSNSKSRNAEGLVKLNKHEVSADYGVGFEFHFPLFVLSPELKASNSLINTHSPDPNLIFSRVLQGLHNRVFQFSLIFEG
jgi:hypothetical protein